MISLQHTDKNNEDFKRLVTHLDAELKELDGEVAHIFYDQYNGIEKLNHVVMAYVNEDPLACGALRARNHETMEIKRMYTAKEARGQGLASMVLHNLESWAKEMGYLHCVLETGIHQKAALALYKKQGYREIPKYAPYEDVQDSFCLGKTL